MASSTSNKLGTEKIGKLLFQLALPAITAQLINMLYNIVDRIYIGHIEGIGSLALTGVGVCFPIIILISAFSSLIGMGGAPQASIRMGEQNTKEAEHILGNCFAILILLAAALTAIFLIWGEPLLQLFGASSDTLPYALSYLNIYVIGTLFVMISLGLNSFISAQGFAKISMFTVIIGAVLNIILDPVLIFVFHMGVRGAALATIISQCVSAIWVLRFLTGKKTTLKIRFSNMKLSGKILVPVIALGMSPFIMQSTESLLSICFNTSLQKYGGDLAVGSMTILSSIMQTLSLPLSGLTQGAQPIISYNFGAGNKDRVTHTFRLLFISAVTFSTLYWLLNMIAPDLLVGIFASEPELKEMASWALRIYLASGFMMGIQLACQQTFVAIGQAKISLFLALLRKIILLIPLIYILPNFFANKVFAVFLAEPISDFLAASTTFTLFRRRFNKVLNERTHFIETNQC
ncbi:MAG: MATE family efflux transporter [Clostridia bacterium]|nr:MATE family efflux transporter [Lachnospiraceae bacterium]NCC01052.1 MATE family efflux transporter [Clostridia bacterium]NCD02952.1 MATE family efflux transporter [Clostridia bacterium]